MSDPTREYTYLFNTITDIRRQLRDICAALAWAQRQAEELYISRADTDTEHENSTF